MSLGGEVKDCYWDALKKCVAFDGRARRKEYWTFFLVNFIIAVVMGFMAGILWSILGLVVNIALWVYALAIIVPSIAVAVRRLHDTGRSGWWVLIGFIPIIGLVLIVFLIQDSAPGENEYGPNPKG